MINMRMALLFSKVVIILCVFFFGLIFLVQNIEVLRQTFTLSLDLYGSDFKWISQQAVPYYYLIIIAFALGGFFAAAFFLLDRIGLSLSLHKQKSQNNKTIRVLEDEISRLRSENEQLSKELDANKPADAQHALIEGSPGLAASS